MKIGFTGTRKGMTRWQASRLQFLLTVFYRAARPSGTMPADFQFHHGGSGIADREADELANAMSPAFGIKINIVVHPCPGVVADEVVGGNGRVRFNGHDAIFRGVFPPLVRDRHIAEEVDVLVAAPESDQEQVRSGTWATVRYARRAGTPVIMLSKGRYT